MELLSQATRRWRRASRQRWTNWRISTGAWLWRVWRVSSHAPSSVCPRRNCWSCSCPHPTAPPRSPSPLATTISRRSAPCGGGWVSQHVHGHPFRLYLEFPLFVSLSFCRISTYGHVLFTCLFVFVYFIACLFLSLMLLIPYFPVSVRTHRSTSVWRQWKTNTLMKFHF